MPFSISRRQKIIFWQVAFLCSGTLWIWAPNLNHQLSRALAWLNLPGQEFWLTLSLPRIGYLLAGSLLIWLAIYLQRREKLFTNWLVLIVGAGLVVSSLSAVPCHPFTLICQRHAFEGHGLYTLGMMTMALSFFILTARDAVYRQKFASTLLVCTQLLYGMFLVVQLAANQPVNGLIQATYQLLVIVALAWYGREFAYHSESFAKHEARVVRKVFAWWAFVNGILAIVFSLTHIRLLSHLQGLYFLDDGAWLSQHGIISGVAMLYLSRHLARGELRARQIMLVILGAEILKHSLVSINIVFLAIYWLTFVLLFVFYEDFYRGTLSITWRVRLKDLYFLIAGLGIAGTATYFAIAHDLPLADDMWRAADHFVDYITTSSPMQRTHVTSVLLAHSFSVFLSASAIAILWVLFRPYKPHRSFQNETAHAKSVLENYSHSDEDYFKLWPADKQYFWSPLRDTFIAYKIAGPVVFALADPVGKEKAATLKAFLQWCHQRRYKVCFLPIREESRDLYKPPDFTLLQVGSTALVDTQTFLDQTKRDKWWRWQTNRAVKSGFEFAVSSPPHSLSLMRQLRTVSNTWLSHAHRTERSFAMGYFDSGYLQNCQLYYLKDANGRVVAFTNGLPAFSQFDVFTVDLLRHKPDVKGAMPFLLLKTIEDIKNQYPYAEKFDLGFVPFAKTEGALKIIAAMLGPRTFSVQGLEQFKNKFDPVWASTYLAYEGDMGDLAVISMNIEKVMKLPS